MFSMDTPAKINLFLDVCGCRDDGYHDIDTVFCPLPELTDHVSVRCRNSRGLSVECAGLGGPGGRDNICWRSAELFADALGIFPEWRIEVEKSIPIAAGLGGGSSDAAAVLLLLNGLHGDALPPDDIFSIARELGADVPYFLQPELSHATGIGDRLRSLRSGVKLYFVLVSHGFPVSTAWGYDRLDRMGLPSGPAVRGMVDALESGDLEAVCRNSWNVFDGPVKEKFPIVEMTLEFLVRHGCLASHVSGSGPTVYGICRERADAVLAVSSVREYFGPSVWACCSEV